MHGIDIEDAALAGAVVYVPEGNEMDGVHAYLLRESTIQAIGSGTARPVLAASAEGLPRTPPRLPGHQAGAA